MGTPPNHPRKHALKKRSSAWWRHRTISPQQLAVERQAGPGRDPSLTLPRRWYQMDSPSVNDSNVLCLQVEPPRAPLAVQLHAVPPRRANELHHHAPPPVQLGLGLEAAQLHASADDGDW